MERYFKDHDISQKNNKSGSGEGVLHYEQSNGYNL